MSPRVARPFRADHVGSLLRPQRLLDARDEHAAGRGDGAEHAHLQTIGLINDSLLGRPDTLSATTHMCRGNFRSSWVAEGGYDFVAEALFSELEVDGFFPGSSTTRAPAASRRCGSCRRAGKAVVLGLITTKRGELEPKDALKRQIEEAAKRTRPAVPLVAVRLRLHQGRQRADLREGSGEVATRRGNRRRGLGLSRLGPAGTLHSFN